ncbi:amidohydrolase family protein [bacterium]|nr:amidohydrolase family protein [bacterium]
MNWILRNTRVQGYAEIVDIAIDAGKIAAVATNLPDSGDQEWDLAGRVLLPGLVDCHTHLDKAYTGAVNHSGTLLEAIDVWRQTKLTRGRKDLLSAARRALEQATLHGVTALRTHVDAELASDLVAVEALLSLREETRHQIDLQIVVLGSASQSAEFATTMRTALDMGADCIGGAPAITPDPLADLDAIFALAERTGKPIDLHIDETEDPHMLTLAALAERTLAHGLQGQVTAGHCCSLAFVDEPTAGKVIDAVAAAQIHIVTLPLCNLVLMGRGHRPVPRGVTRVKELLAAGVTVSAASDNVQDPFNPFGSHDLLHIAQLTAATAHMTGIDELSQCLDMVTTHPARLFGHSGRIAPGKVADLVVLDTQTPLEAVTAPPLRLATFKRGKLVVKTEVMREFVIRDP